MGFLPGGVLPMNEVLLRCGVDGLHDGGEQFHGLVVLSFFCQIGERSHSGLHARLERTARIALHSALTHGFGGG